MTDHPLTDIRMHDGSRDFLSLPVRRTPQQLKNSLKGLRHVRGVKLAQDVVESWLSFSWHGWEIAINDPFGEYWFFAENPETPEPILEEIRDHFVRTAL